MSSARLDYQLREMIIKRRGRGYKEERREVEEEEKEKKEEWQEQGEEDGERFLFLLTT